MRKKLTQKIRCPQCGAWEHVPNRGSYSVQCSNCFTLLTQGTPKKAAPKPPAPAPVKPKAAPAKPKAAPKKAKKPEFPYWEPYMLKSELKNAAKEAGLKIGSKATKADIIEALEKAQKNW